MLPKHLHMIRPLEKEELGPWSEISYCVEDWRFAEDQDEDGERRIYYSVFSLVVQYAIPFISKNSRVYFTFALQVV